MRATEVAAVALGGAAGAPARYLVTLAVAQRTRGDYPLGTLVVNVLGSLVLGFVTGLALYRAFPSLPEAAIGTGFCGAFTTFSTFTFETGELTEQGRVGAAGAVVATTVLGSAGAAAAGIAVAGWI